MMGKEIGRFFTVRELRKELSRFAGDTLIVETWLAAARATCRKASR